MCFDAMYASTKIYEIKGHGFYEISDFKSSCIFSTLSTGKHKDCKFLVRQFQVI